MKRKRFWIRFAIGFASIYILWIIPAHFFGWDRSPLFFWGDHLILPLFNGVAATILPLRSMTKFLLSTKIYLFILILIPVVWAALPFFEENTALTIKQNLLTKDVLGFYHVLFIFSQLAFVVFMCGIFPFVSYKSMYQYRPNPFLLASLFILAGTFVGIVLFTKELPVWKPTSALGCIFIGWILALSYQRSQKKKAESLTT